MGGWGERSVPVLRRRPPFEGPPSRSHASRPAEGPSTPGGGRLRHGLDGVRWSGVRVFGGSGSSGQLSQGQPNQTARGRAGAGEPTASTTTLPGRPDTSLPAGRPHGTLLPSPARPSLLLSARPPAESVDPLSGPWPGHRTAPVGACRRRRFAPAAPAAAACPPERRPALPCPLPSDPLPSTAAQAGVHALDEIPAPVLPPPLLPAPRPNEDARRPHDPAQPRGAAAVRPARRVPRVRRPDRACRAPGRVPHRRRLGQGQGALLCRPVRAPACGQHGD